MQMRELGCNNIKRVTFVVWSTDRSGGTRVIFELANRLSRKGYRVDIVALYGNHSWHKLNVPITYVKRILNTKYISMDLALKSLGIRLDLVRALAENISQDSVNIATWYPTALSVWFACAQKEACSYLVQDFPQLVLERDGAYGLQVFDVTLRLPFNFLVNSAYTFELVRKRSRSPRVNIVGVGVDLGMFYPRHDRIVTSTGKKLITLILRGTRFKGDEVAVNALDVVNRRIPIHALIVGNKKATAKAFARVKPRFTYTGFSNINDDTLAKLYSTSDVFVFPSYIESFGLPPLEAMACQTPVVTTDCIGNRDYAINGQNALIVPPGDSHALAKATLQVLTDPSLAERLSIAGLNTARAFTWDKVVARVEEALFGIQDSIGDAGGANRQTQHSSRGERV